MRQMRASTRILAMTARRRAATAAATSASGGDAPKAAVASGHWTLATASLDHELVVKKSRFVASAWPVESADAAQRLIAARADPSASHNCWAFRVDGASRSSDDGEPGGTAGRPILGAIEADGLDGVAVLVVRFFGGAKLGAGPLARAYAQAARDAVRAAPKAFVREMARARVLAPQQDVGAVYGVLQKLGASAVGEPDFDQQQQGLALEVSVAADRLQAIAAALAEATAGRGKVEEVGGGGGDGAGG
jgi:putative IMPACT (imprinted ancient) family translation regulator